jgi:hypothetical protein
VLRNVSTPRNSMRAPVSGAPETACTFPPTVQQKAAAKKKVTPSRSRQESDHFRS